MDTKKPVKVWDAPVRLFHWALVACIGFSWWSASEGGLVMQYHVYSGYLILTLLLFRVLWGFVGSTHARFSDFMRGPAATLAAVRELFTRRSMHFRGHNPPGGWMVLALLLALLFQAGTGLFANDDIVTEGPLYRWVGKDLSDRLTGWHKLNFNLILTLTVIHVAAVLHHWLVKRENLVAAMFTGRKRLPAGVGSSGKFVSPWIALLLLAVCVAAVAVVVNLR